MINPDQVEEAALVADRRALINYKNALRMLGRTAFIE